MNTSPEIRAGPPLGNGFRLDGLTIDPRAGDVSGPGGREKLDPKVMDVLVLLAEHAGQVVLREDLIARLWPNVVVTDDALSRCIYELRRQLAQAGSDERYKTLLETLPKRGYRLLATVTALTPEADAPGRRVPDRRLLGIAGLVLAAAGVWFTVNRWSETPRPESARRPATAQNSIAVLPFVDMSAEQDQGYLSDGVAEEILDRLTRIDGLRVIARTSSFTFRDQRADIREIADKLGVSHVLEGSVRRSGDHVRITTQLVDAASNSHVWSKVYDRELGDLFAVQDQIAASVAAALDVALGDAIDRSAAPANAEAHQSFLKGEFFYNRRASGDVARAVKYYELALAIDPRYVKAWVALAGAYSILADRGELPREVARARQGEAAHRAVALDPGSAPSHVRLAEFYFEGGDREAACKQLQIAAILDPESRSITDCNWGHSPPIDVEAEIEHLQRSVERDPLSAVNHQILAVFLFTAGRLEDAKSEFIKARELNPEGHELSLEVVRVLVVQRRYDEAYSAIAALPKGGIRDHGLMLLYFAPGRRAEADAALARLVRKPGTETMDHIRLAEAFAFRGANDEAIATLQRFRNTIDPAEDSSHSRIWWMQREMALSPFLTPLHRDPRWHALMTAPN
jgi:TolB-like protein/DNA-binding winged helix-turn-helix (wHTH) protein/Tfp pilus assembly protein PilF